MRITNIKTIANAISANEICGACVNGLSMLRVSMDLCLLPWLHLRPSVGSAMDFISRRVSGMSDLLLRDARALAALLFQPALKQSPGNTGCQSFGQLVASLMATPCYATASKPTGYEARTEIQREMRFELPAFSFQKPC